MKVYDLKNFAVLDEIIILHQPKAVKTHMRRMEENDEGIKVPHKSIWQRLFLHLSTGEEVVKFMMFFLITLRNKFMVLFQQSL